MGTTTAGLACSFCGRPGTQVGALVAGPGVYICDGCVALCVAAIAGKEEILPGAPAAPPSAPRPHGASLDDVLAAHPPVAAADAEAERDLLAWVQEARSLGGTWTQIGEALGMTRQSAWERFAPGE